MMYPVLKITVSLLENETDSIYFVNSIKMRICENSELKKYVTFVSLFLCYKYKSSKE